MDEDCPLVGVDVVLEMKRVLFVWFGDESLGLAGA